MTALVTAVYGGYDPLRPLPADHGFADAVLVTDRPVDVPGWRVVVEPRPGVDPRLAAKRPKTHPWEFTDEASSLWLDGSYRVTGRLGPVVDAVLEAGDVAAIRHPDRDSGLSEARFSEGLPKYRDALLTSQRAFYGRCGLPEGSGLWCCGVLARRHTREQRLFGDTWSREIYRWGVQDQVSFAFLVWQFRVPVVEWRVPLLWSDWWAREPHVDGTS